MRQPFWTFLAVLVCGSACSNESSTKYCLTDSECGDGMVCGTEACVGIARCLRAGCACEPNGVRNACSSDYPTDSCSCEQATCEHPLDSCNEYRCPGVCNLGQSCQFCLEPGACESAEPCLGGKCLLDGAGQAQCRVSECYSKRVRPPLCGSPSAPCGECFEPQCAGLECGEDPVTGLSCGTCAVHHYCRELDHRCVQTLGYTLCEGSLEATPNEVTPARLAVPVPMPTGGEISDGIYDLVGEYEYAVGIADVYQRAALRFFDGGTRAEHIYDAELGSAADYQTPHRLLNVSRVDSTTLSFDVTCPDSSRILFPQYIRAYSAADGDLWLFQQSLIEVYKKRP